MSLLLSFAACNGRSPVPSSNGTTVGQADRGEPARLITTSVASASGTIDRVGIKQTNVAPASMNETTKLPKMQMRIYMGDPPHDDLTYEHNVVAVEMSNHIICSGAYITAHIVVTVSRCFDIWQGELNELQISKRSANKTWTSSVDGVYRYPDTKAKKQVDIALVKTSKAHPAWPDDGKMAPQQFRFELPNPREDSTYINESIYITVLAFGDANSRDYYSESRRTRLLGFRDGASCRKLVGNLNSATEICAPMEGKGRLCRSDEGGPAYFRDENPVINRLIGVYSRSTTKCFEWYQPGVAIFTRISSVMPWILEKIRRYTSDGDQVDRGKKWKGSFLSPSEKLDTSMDIDRYF